MYFTQAFANLAEAPADRAFADTQHFSNLAYSIIHEKYPCIQVGITINSIADAISERAWVGVVAYR